MRHTVRIAMSLLLSLATIGCASVEQQEWTGTPDQAPPQELADWQVEWDDQRRVWRKHGSGEPVGRSEVPTEDWVAEQDALGLRIEATEQLNFGRGSAHTAAIFVLQARDPSNIKTQLETPADTYRLLRRGNDDPDVLAIDRRIVEPGRQTVMKVDRADRARYFILVVGALEFDTNNSARVVEIPQIYDIPRGRERFVPGNVIDTFNPFSSTPDPRPGRLLGWLRLGQNGIERFYLVAR